MSAGRSHISNALAILSGGHAIHGDHAVLPAVVWPALSPHLRALPIVDVGSHNGGDLTIPSAKLGHRVYAYEPTKATHDELLRNLRGAHIPIDRSVAGFHLSGPGRVLVRRAAASSRSGVALLSTSTKYGGVANTLSGLEALPAAYQKVPGGVRQVNVTTVTLSEELQHETAGVYLLKIDAQGHELQVLQGAAEYIRRRPVCMIMLEFAPQALRAAGAEPLAVLKLLTEDFGYQCFDWRRAVPWKGAAPPTLEEFVDAHPPNRTLRRKFGAWTDLLCVRFDLLRR